jgi:TolA-binding protein
MKARRKRSRSKIGAQRFRSASTACGTCSNGASPFVAVAAALQEFKDSVRELRQFEIAPATTGGPGPAEGSAETSAPVALEGQISRMEDELDTLGRGVRALPHADLLSTQLANLKGQIEQLQGYQYVANLTRVAPDLRNAEAPAAGHSMPLAQPMAGTARAVVTGAVGAGSAAASVPTAAEQKAAEVEKPVAANGEAPAADASPIAMI